MALISLGRTIKLECPELATPDYRRDTVHLAAYFQQQLGSTLLIDGDPNRSVSGWAKRGALPFPVADERSAAKAARQYDNLIFDTKKLS